MGFSFLGPMLLCRRASYYYLDVQNRSSDKGQSGSPDDGEVVNQGQQLQHPALNDSAKSAKIYVSS